MRRYRKIMYQRSLLAAAIITLGVVALAVSGATSAEAGPKKPAPRTKVVKGGGPARAFTVLRDLLPAEASLLVGINLASVRGTELGTRLQQIGQNHDDLRGFLGQARAVCGLDPMDSASDLAVAFQGGDVVVAVALRGLGERELTTCAEKIAAGEPGKLTVERRGARVGYQLGSQRLETAWPTADVVVFASEVADAVVLERMIAGRGAFARQPVVRRAFAGLSLTGLAYVVHAKKDVYADVGVFGASGHAALADRSLVLDGRFFAAGPEEARRLSASWTTEVQSFAGGAGPPLFTRMLAGVKIYPEEDLVRITASFAQKDLLELMQLFGSFGP